MSFLDVERVSYLWLLLGLVPLAAVLLRTRRKLTRPRFALAAALRGLLYLCLVLALAGLTWKDTVDALAVVFVVDRSASVGTNGLDQGVAIVEEALGSREADDVAGVVVFGSEPLVEAEVQDDLAVRGYASVPSPHQTDIASAIRLGTALLPSDRAGRVVVLTDGEQTRGDAAAQALLTASDNLQIGVVPIGGQQGPEVLLEDLLMPARVDEGSSYDLRVVARSQVPTTGRLRLYRNEQALGEMAVTLSGDGRADVFTLAQGDAKPGLYRYRAVLDVDAEVDSLTQNNTVMSTVQVAGRPKVLYVEGYPEHREHLVRVLDTQGIAVDAIGPEQLPPGLSDLRPYAAVILSDVPAYTMTVRQQEALRSYVRDLGRGLIMVGGDRSFGVGGYYDTPVEDALPVHMDIKDKTRFPKLGIVLAIDKSGSMGGGAGSKMALAREAAIETAELLSDRDMIGVIGFDGAASWIVPLQELDDRPQVINTIAALRAGGGTDIYPALERGIKALEESDAALKHVILISDGMTTSGNYQPLIQGANKNSGVTLSTVAIGSDADRQTMRDFATWGEGSYYLVTDPTAIPAIFTRETMLATRAFLVEEPVTAVYAAPSDVLATMRAADVPTLYGFVGTQAKDRAVTPLVVMQEDEARPLLSHWRYGLGRSIAWTSDAKPRWAKDWVGTSSYTQFWTQAVRWAIGNQDVDNLVVETELRNGELIITVDAFDGGGGFRNFLDGEARVVAPDLTVHPHALQQIAPGRYQAVMPVDQDGSWLVGVALKDGETLVGQAVAEAVQPYSPEYRRRGDGPALLTELGTVGGAGTYPTPAAIFARPEVARAVPKPLWPWLLGVAGLLLLLDVASRRLDFRRSRGQLVQATARAPAGPRWRPKNQQSRPPTVVNETEVAELEPAESEPTGPKVDVPPESYAGRLLAARRKARDKMGDDT